MNIVEMYEKDIIPLKSLVLLGIYHEDELANAEEARAYQDAFDYVRQNRHLLGALPQDHRPGGNQGPVPGEPLDPAIPGDLRRGQRHPLHRRHGYPSRDLYGQGTEPAHRTHDPGALALRDLVPLPPAGRRAKSGFLALFWTGARELSGSGHLPRTSEPERGGRRHPGPGYPDRGLRAENGGGGPGGGRRPDPFRASIWKSFIRTTPNWPTAFHRIRLGKDSVFVRRMGFPRP